ncbi:hypothetical protein CERZMDRAFT_85644 [Cercospora zeae-maydis SCOH1-5]|uniref:Uncharacterized protein n=1 Tax=Cercospora zeae-maydis SCOH1-5 TaxID=717836 RepID=A0A6A6FCL9_9PEZI|nr:hypothetical protein CERZMDRAFT_85644 [Cercospora zeae-maydis SCOH1-5]
MRFLQDAVVDALHPHRNAMQSSSQYNNIPAAHGQSCILPAQSFNFQMTIASCCIQTRELTMLCSTNACKARPRGEETIYSSLSDHNAIPAAAVAGSPLQKYKVPKNSRQQSQQADLLSHPVLRRTAGFDFAGNKGAATPPRPIVSSENGLAKYGLQGHFDAKRFCPRQASAARVQLLDTRLSVSATEEVREQALRCWIGAWSANGIGALCCRLDVAGAQGYDATTWLSCSPVNLVWSCKPPCFLAA